VDKQLELLIELQGLDTEISQLVKEKEAIPKEIRALEQRFSEEESRLEAIKRDLEDLQKRRRSQERELEHQGLEMKKRQGRLLEVKTNKEYSAILHEIEGLKEKQSALEDEILEVLEEIDRQAGQVKRQSERLAQEKAQCEQGRKEWEGKLTETEARLSALLKERANRASDIDPALMQTYMRVFENRQGLAVVPVRERSCSGCFVTLTPQVFQEAKKNDRIITCSNCNRFVYWKEP
jgi:predicted  nucleic acid-binding Zn-ribbon protein